MRAIFWYDRSSGKYVWEVNAMLSLKPVILEYGGNLCRRCLNRRYEVHLAHRDCREAPNRECPCCRKVGSVVVGLTLSGRFKLLTK